MDCSHRGQWLLRLLYLRLWTAQHNIDLKHINQAYPFLPCDALRAFCDLRVQHRTCP